MKSAIIEAAEVLEAITNHLGTHPVISREEVKYRVSNLAQRLRAEADSRSAPQAVNESLTTAWQPIETAPKDGTEVLVCCEHPNLYSPTTGVWATYHPNSQGVETWRTSAIGGNKMGNVTHWMPLPSPPASNEAGE